MTVKELLEKADSKELTEWMVYYRLKNEEYDKMSKKEQSKESLANQIKASMVGYKR